MDSSDSKHLTISQSTDVVMLDPVVSSDDDEEFVPKKAAVTPRKKNHKE